MTAPAAAEGAGIFAVLAELLGQGEAVALATIVGRRGSTPREAGTKMLVRSGGAIIGTVGGGAAEAEICRQAAAVLQDGRPRLVTVGLTGTLRQPGQGICGGTFEVYLDPWVVADGSDPALPLAAAVGARLADGGPALLATVIEATGAWAPGVGGRWLLGAADAAPLGAPPEDLAVAVAAAAPAPGAALPAGPWVRELTAADGRGWARVLLDPLLPPDELLVLGGGHVARPLAAIAATCGLRVTVVDDRPQFASAERFPGARVVVADAGRFLADQPPGAQTHVVLLSRGPAQDITALRALLTAGAGGYVGLIGSERRVWAVLSTLRADGVAPAQLARVHGPVGLDLGGTTPAEIALEIMAELVQWRRQGSGEALSTGLHRRLLREAPAAG